jgi:hypothetical protein
MIIREILKDPFSQIARFDFFNDYEDTRFWLGITSEEPQDVLAFLNAAHVIWLRKHREAVSAQIKAKNIAGRIS